MRDDLYGDTPPKLSLEGVACLPLQGVRLTGRWPYPLPLLGDAALLNRTSMPREMKRHVPRPRPSTDEGVEESDGERCFVVVLRRATWIRAQAWQSDGSSPKLEWNPNPIALHASAEARASEVTGLLAVAMLQDSLSATACALSDHVFRRKRQDYYYFQGPGWGSRFGSTSYGGVQTVRAPCIQLSYRDFRRLLAQPVIAPLARVLSLHKRTKLHGVVAGALRRWIQAFHHESLEFQTLGMVNVLELLLADRRSGFDTLMARTRALVGDDSYFACDGDAAFEARHRYVHQGAAIADVLAVNRWIALAMTAILHAAAACRHFGTKGELAAALDLITQANLLPGAVGDLVSTLRLRACFDRFVVPHFPFAGTPMPRPTAKPAAVRPPTVEAMMAEFRRLEAEAYADGNEQYGARYGAAAEAIAKVPS